MLRYLVRHYFGCALRMRLTSKSVFFAWHHLDSSVFKMEKFPYFTYCVYVCMCVCYIFLIIVVWMKMAPICHIGRVTIERRGFVGSRCSLVGESLSQWWPLDFHNIKPGPVSFSLFLLPVDQDIELLAHSPAPCLPACYSCPNNDRLNFWMCT